MHVADVATDASSARYSKFKTLNPCEPMLTIRMLFAFQPTLTKSSNSISQGGFSVANILGFDITMRFCGLKQVILASNFGA